MLPVAVARSMRNVPYFRFVDDVMLSHNGAKGQNQRRHVSSLSSPGGGTEDEVCRLRMHLVCMTKLSV